MGLVLAADAGYVVWGLAHLLPRASESLEAARSGLAGADMTAFRRHSSSALDAALEAGRLEAHPSFRMATLLPLLGTEARTLAALSDSAEHAARAGLAGAQAGDAIGITPDGLAASVYQDGRVDLEAVARASPFMEAAARRLGLAAALLRSAPEPVLSPLRDALVMAREQTIRAEESAGGAAALFERLPSLLGGESQRRYLLAFQALGEARATGGVMGAYGVLEAADGRLRLTRVGPVEDGFPNELANPVSGPPWFERSYGSQHALSQVQQANLSPNFPVAAKVWLRMYRSANGDRLDGVVAMDPLTLAEVMRGTGPIALGGFRGPLTAGSVSDSLLLDSYLDFSTEAEQNRYLIEVVRGFWSELRAGDIDSPGAFAEGLGEAVRTKHLKVYSRDAGDQRALSTLGLDGDYPAGPNLQLVFNNNYSTNKVDYFLQRRIETTIDLLPTGDARVATTASLTNAAPSGPSSELLGPGPQADDPPGLNRMFLGFLLPRGANIGALSTGEQRSSLPSTYSDSGYPVAWDLVEVPAGETGRAIVEYTIEDAAQLRDDGGRLTWSLEPQTGVTPARFSLRVSPPDGYRFLGQADSQSFVAAGVLDQTRIFRVELEPSG